MTTDNSMDDNDCVVDPELQNYEEAHYVHTLMELRGYVVRYGRGRVLDDLNRLLAAQERPLEPYSRASRQETIDQEEQLSYDPRDFGADYPEGGTYEYGQGD